MAKKFFRPLPGERKFIYGLNMKLIQRLLWPLFAVFLLLAFADVLTTLIAFASGGGFVELNPFASRLFQLKLPGFILAYFMKYLAAIPLFYMISLKEQMGERGFEVRLLKFTALVVLVGADIYLGCIVLVNNLPSLLAASGTLY